MSIVAAQSLHKAYGQHVVLGAVAVAIAPGERVGMVGKNGAGKSTLARILAGVEPSDGGSVARRRGARVLYLEQVPQFDGDPSAHEAATAGLAGWHDARSRHERLSAELGRGEGDLAALLAAQTTAAEEVERLGGWEQGHRVDAVLGHLGIERPEARLSELSGGEQRRVALARILIARPDLAILDEPTNHLDAETIEWLERYLLDEHSGALLLVTLDRYLLDRVAQRTLEVADGEVHAYDGGYGLYLEQKAERMAHAARTEQNRQNFLRREIDWLRRQPKARSTKQKARVERAEEALAVQAPKADAAPQFALDRARAGKTVLETAGLTLAQGGRILVAGLDLFIAQGDRIGVVGANGSGKTTLLRALQGAHPLQSGALTVGQNTRFAYFDQLRGGLAEDQSIFDNVGGDQSRIELGGEVIEVRSYLERFGFDGHQQQKKVEALSGGERARVALAKMLRQSANLLILDEPTNDLDVATLGALESMLVDYGVTALIVTHDRWFLDRVATSILAFEGEGRVVHYPGNYETFCRLRAEAREQRALTEVAQQRSEPPREPRAARAVSKRALSRAEERELSGLPDAIDQAEASVAEIETRLADPGTYAQGGDRVPELLKELETAKRRAAELITRWEELELKKGGG